MKLRSNGVSWREIDGEMILFDATSSKYLTTNRTGTWLIRQLTEECSLDDLVGQLANEFDVPLNQAADDVKQFVSMLRDKGLLREDRFSE